MGVQWALRGHRPSRRPARSAASSVHWCQKGGAAGAAGRLTPNFGVRPTASSEASKISQEATVQNHAGRQEPARKAGSEVPPSSSAASEVSLRRARGSLPSGRGARERRFRVGEGGRSNRPGVPRILHSHAPPHLPPHAPPRVPIQGSLAGTSRRHCSALATRGRRGKSAPKRVRRKMSPRWLRSSLAAHPRPSPFLSHTPPHLQAPAHSLFRVYGRGRLGRGRQPSRATSAGRWGWGAQLPTFSVFCIQPGHPGDPAQTHLGDDRRRRLLPTRAFDRRPAASEKSPRQPLRALRAPPPPFPAPGPRPAAPAPGVPPEVPPAPAHPTPDLPPSPTAPPVPAPWPGAPGYLQRVCVRPRARGGGALRQ